MTGPLAGVRVLELATMGGPSFACMLLADLGADVIRVERIGGRPTFPGPAREELLHRGKRSVELDLRSERGREAALGLIAESDILVEGYAPGAAERLGLGPAECHQVNGKLVYCRLTNWGQDGPWATHNSQDINVLAAAGVLGAIGEAGSAPQIPLDLVGDFAGGGLYAVVGALSALLHARTTGVGQVVDSAAVDGVAHLMTFLYSALNVGAWRDERAVNLIDGAAPFYRTYPTEDGRVVAVGALDLAGYRSLLRALDLDLDPRQQHDRDTWASNHALIAERFAARPWSYWQERFDGSECVTLVESMRSAVNHPHLRGRGTFVEQYGQIQPAPAPRFGTTPTGPLRQPPERGEHTLEVIEELGLDAETLLNAGAARQWPST